MTLTEVVFDVSDPDYPLLRLTREHTDVQGIYRVLDAGRSTGVVRALVSLAGPAEVLASAAKELRASGRYTDVSVLATSRAGAVVALQHAPPDPRAREGTMAEPAALLAERFGNDIVFEPFLFERGTLRVRAIIPQALETKRALTRLQEIQHEARWGHFRIVRVNEFRALRFADAFRRLLTPDEEEMLRLALSLGYYETPKGCTLEGIAQRVGLSVSPVHKRLKSVEQTLINAFVSPEAARVPDPRRRARAATTARAPDVEPGELTEVAVRFRWPAYRPALFTARHPGARVVLQAIGDDARAGESTTLVVVAAREDASRAFMEELAADPCVRAVEALTKESDHATLKVRSTLPTAVTWTSHAAPFPHLAQRFGREAVLRPVVVEGRDVWLKLVLVRNGSPDSPLARLTDAAREARWEDVELVSSRSLAGAAALGLAREAEKMTQRQEEVLKIAHALGYYKTPRECTLQDIARTLGISANAIHKNLTAAEEKIITSYLADAL